MPDRILSASKLYGKGVFTTLAISDGRPFLWEKHWRRLAENANSLEIDLSEHGESTTLNSLLEAISTHGPDAGRARVTFSDESPSSIWSKSGERKTSLSIVVAERRPIPNNFKLTVSPYRVNTTSPLAGVKSCNYLEHLLAYEEASERGFHEALRVNERGEVASACMANVFWEKDGKLFTPSLKTACLPGTTREFVLDNLNCEQVEAGIADLRSAERIFLTSAGLAIVTAAESEGRSLETSEHPLSSLLPF